MKVSKGLGGMGAVTMSESSKPHPNSHFELSSMRIKKADDGSYVIDHEMSLKKKHQAKEGYHGSYRDSMTHTAAGPQELMAHIKKHFGGKSGGEDGADE